MPRCLDSHPVSMIEVKCQSYHARLVGRKQETKARWLVRVFYSMTNRTRIKTPAYLFCWDILIPGHRKDWKWSLWSPIIVLSPDSRSGCDLLITRALPGRGCVWRTTEPRGRRAGRGKLGRAFLILLSLGILLSVSLQAFESLLGPSNTQLPRISHQKLLVETEPAQRCQRPRQSPTPTLLSGSQPCYHRPHQKPGRGLTSCQA